MYCILITGIPASGKTTMAECISRRFGLPVISKDLIKEKLYDQVGFHSREEKVKLGIASMEIMYYVAEQMMRCGKAFILENNFENISRDGLFAILEKYSYTAITVRLTGDYELIYRRFEERNSSPERHRGHVVDDQYPEVPGFTGEHPTMTRERYIEAIKTRGFDTFAGNGPCITVDTTDFERVDMEAILKELEGYFTAETLTSEEKIKKTERK